MSAEISRIGDYSYRLPEGVFLLETDADYVKACHALSEGASGGMSLIFWVRKRHHFTWLQKFCEEIRLSVRFTEKTARDLLADAWNVAVPDWLTDEDCAVMKLLDLDLRQERPCRFEEALLGHFLGAAFRGERLDRDRIGEAVATLARPEIRVLLDRNPVLLRCLREQGQRWVSHADPTWEKTLIENLIDEPERLWQDLSLWALLSGYPEKLLEYVVPLQRAKFLRGIPGEAVKTLPLERKAVEEALTQIEMFFRDVGEEIVSSDAFRRAVFGASGRLFKEFKLLRDLLTAGRFAPSAEDVRAVREKFRDCPGLDAAELAILDYLVVPPRPLPADGNAFDNPSAWIAWTEKDYIPYRHWQTKSGHDDAELEKVVQSFSDWYIRDYATLHQSTAFSLVHALGAFGDSIRSETLSLIILVDGLPLTFWQIFQEALRRAGFHRCSLEFRFSPLPTDTEFVKPALISGDWNCPPGAYETLLRTRVGNDWSGRQAVYLSNLKMLSDFMPTETPTVVLLNLLTGDEILHDDMAAKGTTHEEELHRLFMRVGEAAASLLDRWSGARDAFGLYVLTDHGACCVLDQERQSFESRITGKLFADERRRFAVVEKGMADAVPENLWSLGYRFVPPFAKGENVFFIPRGHSTVRSGAGKGYSHGGATPEEVIVPTAVFKATKVARKTPKGRFIGLPTDSATGKALFHIQRLTRLSIEIMNPNPEDLRVVRATILSPEAELKGRELPLVAKGGVATVSLECYFNRSALGQGDLTVQLVYEIAGEERAMELKAAAEFRSALTGGFSLRDLK